MKRNEFIKTTCMLSMCSCAAPLFAQDSDSKDVENPKIKEFQWKLDFIQNRFAKLVDIIDKEVDEDKKNKIFESLGRECAKENIDSINIFKDDLNGFLEDIQKKWVERAEYDWDKNIIRIYDKKRDNCFCPFVKDKVTSSFFCNCSKGWQKETYEYIIGKPVVVEIEESILRGGERCAFTIKIL